MAVSAAGIIINVIMLIFIIILVIMGISFNNQLSRCENYQSPFCYSIQCPCDNSTDGPCFGYAKRPGPRSGTWYCSSAPNALVNDDGSSAN